MSDPSSNSAPSRPRRHLVVSIIMFMCGLVLLLPGFCALISVIPMIASFGGRTQDFVGFAIFLAICLLVSFGGIMLLRKTFK